MARRVVLFVGDGIPKLKEWRRDILTRLASEPVAATLPIAGAVATIAAREVA